MSQRSAQVSEELRKIVSMILIDDMSSDPRLGFVTITRIELTDDLRFARIYYSVLGPDDQKEATSEAIQDNQGFIRRLAVQRINMKYAMEIKFELDRSIEHSFKIDSILNKIKKEDTQKPSATGSE